MVKPNPIRDYFQHPAKPGTHAFITTNILYGASVFLTMIFIAFANNILLFYIPSFIIIFWSQYILRFRKGAWNAMYKAITAVLAFFSVVWLSTGFLLHDYWELLMGLLSYGVIALQSLKTKRPYDMFQNYYIDPYT